MINRNKYTEEDYKNKCKDLALIYIGHHIEKKKGTMIDFMCPIHEGKGIQSKDWSHFKDYAKGCSYCTGRGKTNEDFIEALEKKNIELLSDYSKCDEPCIFRCKICGCIWKARIIDVLREERTGCPNCALEKRRKCRLKSTKQFIEDLVKVNSDIEVLGEYTGTHKKIKVRCKICGTVWEAYPSNLLNRSAGCPGCNISTGEKALLDALTKMEVKFTPQYPIHDGKHKRPLRYDAFDECNRVAFEYNGEQHYYPVDFAGNGKEWALEQFEITKERDISKLKYSEEHNIPVIVIPYWDRDDIDGLIKTKLKEMNLKLAS